MVGLNYNVQVHNQLCQMLFITLDFRESMRHNTRARFFRGSVITIADGYRPIGHLNQLLNGFENKKN